MLQRKAKAQFESWLASSPNKALLVKGARQVGKSYLVNVFANESFENVVTFDLIADASVRDSFLAAKSADDLLMRMSIAATQPMVANKTVVVIDEVQRCPNVVTFIKYLVQRGDVTAFAPAADIDPAYAQLFYQALRCGVEVYVYRARISEGGIDFGERLNVVPAR